MSDEELPGDENCIIERAIIEFREQITMNDEVLLKDGENQFSPYLDNLLLVAGGLVLIFSLQGGLFVSMFLYSALLYPIVGWYPQHEIVGGIVTYSIFVILIAIMLIVIDRYAGIKNSQMQRALGAGAGLYLLAFPITPILWFNDRYVIPGPAIQYIFGIEVSLWPFPVLLGLLVLLLLWREPTLSMNPRKATRIQLLFLVLAIIIVAIDFVLAYFRFELNHLEMWVTPFTLLLQVSGLSLSIAAILRFHELNKTKE